MARGGGQPVTSTPVLAAIRMQLLLLPDHLLTLPRGAEANCQPLFDSLADSDEPRGTKLSRLMQHLADQRHIQEAHGPYRQGDCPIAQRVVAVPGPLASPVLLTETPHCKTGNAPRDKMSARL